MPRVPVPAAPSVRLAGAPQVNLRIDPRLDEQSIAAQRGLDQVARETQQIAFQEAEKANTAMVQEANAQFIRWRNERLFGENGYYNQKGKNALVNTSEILGEYDSKIAEISGSMPSDFARIAFQRIANEDRGSFESGVMRHFSGEKDSYYREQNDAQQREYASEIVHNAGDEEVLARNFKRMDDAVDARAQMEGLPPEKVAEQKKALKSGALKDSITRMATGPEARVGDAQKMLDKYRDEMTTDDYEAAAAKVKPMSDQQKVVTFRLEMDTTHGVGKNTSQKLAEADKRFASEPHLLTLARNAIIDADREQEYADNEYMEGLTQGVYAIHYMGQGSMADVIAKARTPEEVAKITELDRKIRDARRSEYEGTPEFQLEQTRSYLSFAETLDADPNVVMTGKPLELAVFMGLKGEYLQRAANEIEQRRDAVRRGTSRGAKINYPTAVSFGQRVRQRTAAALGIDTKLRGKPDKWSPEDIAFYDQVAIGAENDIAAWVEENGGQEPPPDVQEKIIGAHLKEAKYAVPGGWFSGPSEKTKLVGRMTEEERKNRTMDPTEIPAEQLYLVDAAKTAFKRVNRRAPSPLDLKVALYDIWNFEGDPEVLQVVYGPDIKANEAAIVAALSEAGMEDTPKNRLEVYALARRQKRGIE